MVKEAALQPSSKGQGSPCRTAASGVTPEGQHSCRDVQLCHLGKRPTLPGQGKQGKGQTCVNLHRVTFVSYSFFSNQPKSLSLFIDIVPENMYLKLILVVVTCSFLIDRQTDRYLRFFREFHTAGTENSVRTDRQQCQEPLSKLETSLPFFLSLSPWYLPLEMHESQKISCLSQLYLYKYQQSPHTRFDALHSKDFRQKRVIAAVS